MQWLVYLQALNSAGAFVTYLIQNNNNKKKRKAEDTLCFDALITIMCSFAQVFHSSGFSRKYTLVQEKLDLPWLLQSEEGVRP